MAELFLPDARDWIASGEAGAQQGMTDRKNRTNTQAGGLMASGDYAGAASALYGVGDLQTGSAVQKAGQDQARVAEKDTRQKTVQAKLEAGDFAGAYAAAGSDPDLLDGLNKVSEHVKETTSTMAGALQALKGDDGHWLPPEVARPKYEAMKANLLARGLDPRQVNSYDPTPENNASIEGQVLGLQGSLALHKPVAVGRDLIDPATGRAIYQGTDWKTVPDGGKLVPVTGGRSGLMGSGATAGGSSEPAPQAPAPAGGVYDQVADIAHKNGAKPEEVSYLQRLAQVESAGKPTAQNGSSTGVFQFHPDTFAALGGHDIHSVPEQTYAALALQRRDRANLQQIGVEPTDANAYIMHQQGAGGGRALLTSDPNANAVQVLTPVYGSADVARKAIVGNGGSPDMTAGQFVGLWQQRWAGGGAQGGHSNPPHGAAPQAGANPNGDPIGTIYGAPKPAPAKARPATAQEKAAFGIPADVPAQMKPDGTIDVISGVAARAKQAPPKVQQGYAENNATLTQIDKAIALLKQHPHAMGLMNAVGDDVRQRTDQNGITTRAAVANVGAVRIHDLSGAAVTAAETPRLKPFIPFPTDTAEAAILKLRQLREQVANINSQIEVQYGEDRGYQPIGGRTEPAASAPSAGAKIIRYDAHGNRMP